MKVLVFGAVIALAALIAKPACAGPWHGFGGAQVQAQMQRPRPEQFQRQPQRDFRGAEQPPERAPQRGDGRLTEEERRNLHRDLDRANREIYKGRR